MALLNDPVFAQVPKTAGIAFAAGSQTTQMDPASVAPTTIVTASADGSLVTHLTYHGEVTVTAQKVVLWLQPGGAGSWFIHTEKLQAAYTMAEKTAQDPVIFVDKNNPNSAIRLAASDVLGITHHVDLQGMALAEYTDF